MESGPVPSVRTIRVLGMLIQRNTGNAQVISRLQSTMRQLCGLIKRVATRHAGMREGDLCRLVQAFLISRIVYSFPYYHLRRADMNKLNALIRQAYKIALGLPKYTNPDKLSRLGVYNTIDEIIEAHKTAQIFRLSSTQGGRHILDKLDLNPPVPSVRRTPLPQITRQQLIIKPVPKNMLPGRHDNRSAARAKELWDKYKGDHSVAYVDAAAQGNRKYVVSVVTESGLILNAATVEAFSALEAEESAIAHAITNESVSTIVSDSKSAILNCSKGTISKTTQQILRNYNHSFYQSDRLINLVCVPAHSGNPGNEEAHRIARGLTNREARHSDSDSPGGAVATYN